MADGNRAAPGVVITEGGASPNAIVGVQTAVPAFIGYTAKAVVAGRSAYFTPVLVNTVAEFETTFGAGFATTYDIVEVPSPIGADFTAARWNAATQTFAVKFYALVRASSTFNLYNSLRLFYSNGGGPCYVVSVGDYTDDGRAPDGVAVDAGKLTQGLTAIAAQTGPTMLVVPDAVSLKPDATPVHGLPVSAAFNALAQAILAQCGALQDRVAILDIYGADALKKDPHGNASDNDLSSLAGNFQSGVGDAALNYGMAYFPFLVTSLITPDDTNYRHFNIGKPDQLALLQGILTDTAAQLYPDPRPGTDPADNGNPRYLQLKTMIAAIATTTDAGGIAQLNQGLASSIPLLRQMETVVATAMNLLPPSGAMAGIYAFTDSTRGVWNAPASVAPVAVMAPSVRLTDQQQGPLNVPLNGKAINVIRYFPGRGTLVWGARTLDGNSNEYRYIPVRRTLVYIETSIKAALVQFTFAPNDNNTWVAVTGMVSNFLTTLWQQGGLMGDRANDAFAVRCGLGSTMTAADVLDGTLIVNVMMAMVRPAEFVVLTFRQKVQGAA